MATNFTNNYSAIQLGAQKFENFENLKDSIEYPVLITFAIFGILSSVSTLETLFRNKQFSEPCFICYQAIAFFEINVSLGYGLYFVQCAFGDLRKSYGWVLLQEVALRFLLDPFREAVAVLTVLLSISRIVACFFPTKFHLIDSRSVCFAAVVLSVAPFVAIDLPHVLLTDVAWDEERKIYVRNTSGWIITICAKIKDIAWLTLPIAVSVSTVLAVAALLKGIFLKRRLFRQTSNQSTRQRGNSTAIAMDAAKRNLQLCYLQMCLAIPLICYNSLFFMAKFWDDAEIEVQKRRGDFSQAYQQVWLWVFLYVAEGLAHCVHFYLYMIFSQGFRNGFLNRFFKKDGGG